MKLIALVLVLVSGPFCLAFSDFESRRNAAAAENEARWHTLYQQRTQDMKAAIAEKIQRMGAPHGGASEPYYKMRAGVSGSTFLAHGVMFNAGDYACMLNPVSLDFIDCRGPELTKCPDFKTSATCFDSNKNEVRMNHLGKVTYR